MILVTFAVPFESAAFRRRAMSRKVRILHTGVGADSARAALEHTLCEALPERVIASGFAGGLIPGLQIGDIVCDGPDDAPWRRARLSSAGEVLATTEAKRKFREDTGAEVVDMETDAIREVCAVANVPVMALRAISDGAGDDLGLPPELLDALSSRPLRAAPRAAWMLLRDGGRRRAFLRLVRNCRVAQLALADALEREISRS